ncbi:hypothetical protein LguiA_026188 [Lonicera macranthoides]
MRNSVFTPIFIITIITICCVSIVPINAQCLEDQRSLLLQLQNTLEFDSSYSTKLVQWNHHNKDCCLWEGITCSKAGHVTGLDLNDQSIYGGIDNSSSLFSLRFLQSLNLADNYVNSAEIPSAFINLASLTYLNLSNSGFGGQIPIELSQLTRLVTLDLSTSYYTKMFTLKLENPNLNMFVQNLTQLTELYLDRVEISAQGYDWGQPISSWLPNLRVLSLSSCNLSGPIDSSLLKLQFLSVILLSGNNLNAPVPEFLANFKNLTELDLSSCGLNGALPEKFFHLQTLQILDLSFNAELNGSLPEFPQNGKLTQLAYLDLSHNMFTGAMPWLQMSKKLIQIDLSYNNLSVPLSFTQFEGFVNLTYIDLQFNSFTGRIPSSLFGLPSLKQLLLSNNHFDGSLAEIPKASSSMLETLDLEGNKLEGEIPSSFFDLKSLDTLYLMSNNLNGTIQLENFQKLVNLTTLDLSYNNLSIETGGNHSGVYPFPQITTLKLASCKLRNFPDLKNQTEMSHLDLSDNQIGGEIPNWIWKVGNGSLSYLNLSHNFLENLQEPYVTPRLDVLDLHSNHLRGKLPLPPDSATYVDYSSNYFSSSIPVGIGNNIQSARLFSVANNNLTGTIPISICNASNPLVLDMSNNGLSGPIPLCLIEMSETLGVLNLGKNRLSGNLSRTFTKNCSLQTLDLCDNQLEGKVPESISNCTWLEVLNLGNNQINDTFPCFLNNSTNLRVLVLRSNMFHGGIKCPGVNKSWPPSLQIIDIASNNFSGALTPKYFLKWKAMMDNPEPEVKHLQFSLLGNLYYQDTVTVRIKGLEMDLVKILTIFTVIDFSMNNFDGNIPETIGELKSLYALNLSRNALTGSIPSSLGNLKQLGSLDLSVNKLIGKIPQELTSITFLSALNLSYNKLIGKIPSGNQFTTFAETSFEGNEGLCGLQLNKSCSDIAETVPMFKDKHPHPEDGKKWEFLSAASVGYVVGVGFVIGPLFFCERWSKWYGKHIDRVVLWIVNQKGYESRNCKRKAYKKPIQRR